MCDRLEQDLQRWGEAERAKATQMDVEVADVFRAAVRRRQAEQPRRRSIMSVWGAGAALAALLLLAIWLAPRGLVDGPSGSPSEAGSLTSNGAQLTMLEMRHAALGRDSQLRLPPASSVSWMADPSLTPRRPAGAG